MQYDFSSNIFSCILSYLMSKSSLLNFYFIVLLPKFFVAFLEDYFSKQF